MHTTLDIQKLRKRIHEVSAEIADLKALRRQPKQPRWTWQAAHSLTRLKMEATVLCALRSRNRGRQHLRHFPYGMFADQAAFETHLDDVAAGAYAAEAEESADRWHRVLPESAQQAEVS